MTETSLYGIEDIGCYIDASCESADSCNLRTIQFAVQHGFDPKEMPEKSQDDYSEILSWIADEALNYLNSLVSDDVCFYFDDNSLILGEVEK